ncbi:MAG: Sua5/YciO/YrdC/YwlC family protein [Candidatus Roizmanbacteria bacterium GW2011_GWA2_36_23]|uniref:L-threonylcarbamoyladenylate synthase n=1 Tax=Candidatus Roizmanbacteria bacterium GW2011_GWA2_36_23 TaxID=1618480 RepID=A0A0G0GPY1_9BACT|nr:MAG: Sua5/YciO/YrdC/YwlC family protein [Candidatus Roizmanbacteria bacterium GW2011_GWA2_36_23]
MERDMEIIKVKLTGQSEVIKKSVKVLKEGGLVLFPSDTVYGLLVDARNQKAVEKLILFKNRPPGKPISVFVADFDMMKDYVYISKKNLNLLNQILPGQFTIILNSKHNNDKLLESEKGTLGVRIPDYQLIKLLLIEFASPITATSANLSGRPPHYNISALLNELPKTKKDLIDLIVDAGKLPRNKPSTVLDLTAVKIKIIRQGDIIFQNSQTFITKSPLQTQKIGRFVLEKNQQILQKKPLVFIIEGELGVGKTELVKGMAGFLGIDNIISPTYVIYYEYKISNKNIKNIYHFDLYQIEDSKEFNYLGIESYLKPGNILCFEWGEKSGEIYDLLKSKGEVIHINMEYISEKERAIKINL